MELVKIESCYVRYLPLFSLYHIEYKGSWVFSAIFKLILELLLDQKFITPAVSLTLDYILPVPTHSIAYKSIINIFTKLELKSVKKQYFLLFFNDF